MAVPATLRLSSPPRWSFTWIIGSRDDLLWFIGSAAASYLFLAAYRGLRLPVVSIILVWLFLFDGPHIFGTVTRTYFDPELRTRNRRLLYAPLLLFAVGPLMAVLPALLRGVESGSPVITFLRESSSTTFVFFASMWAYYHILMQHYGFLSLYKKKNRDTETWDNRVDRAFLTCALLCPFVTYMLRVPAARDMWPRLPGSGIESALIWTAFAATAAATLAFVARQCWTLAAGRPLNLPKLLFLAAVIPMHWAVLTSSLIPDVMVPILTVCHNIQYHRIIWFHNTNKYRSRAAYGLAAKLSASFWLYYAFGIAFAFYRLPNYFLRESDLAVGFFWGFSLVHYYLDGKIWKIRRDTGLKQSLQLSGAEAPKQCGA